MQFPGKLQMPALTLATTLQLDRLMRSEKHFSAAKMKAGPATKCFEREDSGGSITTQTERGGEAGRRKNGID